MNKCIYGIIFLSRRNCVFVDKPSLGIATKNRNPAEIVAIWALSWAWRIPSNSAVEEKSRLDCDHTRHKRRHRSNNISDESACFSAFGVRRWRGPRLLLIGSSNRAFEVNGRIFSLLSIPSTMDLCPANGHSFVHIANAVHVKLSEAQPHPLLLESNRISLTESS